MKVNCQFHFHSIFNQTVSHILCQLLQLCMGNISVLPAVPAPIHSWETLFVELYWKSTNDINSTSRLNSVISFETDYTKTHARWSYGRIHSKSVIYLSVLTTPVMLGQFILVHSLTHLFPKSISIKQYKLPQATSVQWVIRLYMRVNRTPVVVLLCWEQSKFCCYLENSNSPIDK